MFELVDAVGIGYDRITFIWWNLALRNIKHTLPPINNLPLLPHTGDVAVAGVYHFASGFVVCVLADASLCHSVRIALVHRLKLLLIKTRYFQHLIQ